MSKEFLSTDFSGVMSDSNLAGIRLEKQIVPKIIEKEYGKVDSVKGFLPNEKSGIIYDLVIPNLSLPEKVIWSTMVTQGHFNKNFQKNVGELLFLKKHFPSVETLLFFGLYAANQNQIERARSYLSAYALLWDRVFIVKSPDPLKYIVADVKREVKDLIIEILKKELVKMNSEYSQRKYNGDKCISLPAISGFSKDYLNISSFVLENDQWLKNVPNSLITKFIKDFSQKHCIPIDAVKTLDKGLTVDLIKEAIAHAYTSLAMLSHDSKMRKIVEEKDLKKFYEYMHKHGNPAKRWDYFNPSESLVAIKLKKELGDKNIEWHPSGIGFSTFLHNLGIFSRPWSWDVKIKSDPPVFIEVKSLSGFKGGSGPKQAGYEAHRVSCKAFLSRYAVDLKKHDFKERNIRIIGILDGFWSGPSTYPQKNVDFFLQIGGLEKVFMIDYVDDWVNFIKRTTII